MMHRIIGLLILLSISNSSVHAYIAREEIKELYYNLGINNQIELYTDTKNKILVSGLPAEASIVQIINSQSPELSELRILGSRTKRLDPSVAGPRLSFALQIPKPRVKEGIDCVREPGLYNSCRDDDFVNLGLIRLKTFKQLGENSYEAISEHEIPVITVFCLEAKPVCGLNHMSELETYRDQCELDKAEAEFQYYGRCD